MSKTNHFSDKFKNKTSEELRKIIRGNAYQNDAKLAAAWELERRDESTEEELKLASGIEAENERKETSRLSGERYQTFWPRFIAAFIDGFVMWPIGFLLSYATNSNIGVIVILGNLLNNLAPYIYSVLLHGNYGQTLGKMVMGVKVVDAKSEDGIDLKQAFLRDSVPIALMIGIYCYAAILLTGFEHVDLATDFAALAPVFFLGFLTILWTIVEILSMLFNEKSRAVHDFIAKTVVVRTN